MRYEFGDSFVSLCLACYTRLTDYTFDVYCYHYSLAFIVLVGKWDVGTGGGKVVRGRSDWLKLQGTDLRYIGNAYRI